MKAKDVFNKLLSWTILSSGPKRPGVLLSRLSSEERKVLRSLKSKDINNRIK